jgi:hypothetical protein
MLGQSTCLGKETGMQQKERLGENGRTLEK